MGNIKDASIKALKVYPSENKLDAEIKFVQDPKNKPCTRRGKWFWLKKGHKWRVVERWRFPFGEPIPTTLICKNCGALARRLVSKEQEGELTGWKWVFLGYVIDDFRDYNPYEGRFDQEGKTWTFLKLPFYNWRKP